MTFEQRVATFIAQGGKRVLAAEFEVAESTVERWAGGISRPHQRVRELVVAWISARTLP